MPGHEYTQSNAKFAMGLESSNPALQQRNQEINNLRSQVSQQALTCPLLTLYPEKHLLHSPAWTILPYLLHAL